MLVLIKRGGKENFRKDKSIDGFFREAFENSEDRNGEPIRKATISYALMGEELGSGFEYGSEKLLSSFVYQVKQQLEKDGPNPSSLGLSAMGLICFPEETTPYLKELQSVFKGVHDFVELFFHKPNKYPQSQEVKKSVFDNALEIYDFDEDRKDFLGRLSAGTNTSTNTNKNSLVFEKKATNISSFLLDSLEKLREG